MRKIIPTPKYLRSRKRCKRKGLDIHKLDAIELILTTRSFTGDEIIKYKVHGLKGKYKGYQELHVDGRHGDWLLIYSIHGNKVTFEDTYVVLEDTGTHDELFGSEYIDLIML